MYSKPISCRDLPSTHCCVGRKCHIQHYAKVAFLSLDYDEDVLPQVDKTVNSYAVLGSVKKIRLKLFNLLRPYLIFSTLLDDGTNEHGYVND